MARELLSLVVPVHNEEPVIPILLERVRSASRTWDADYEILFVDDGSRDGTAAAILDRARSDASIRLIQLSRNFGHQPAVSAGLAHARGDVVVVMDADLQDPPEEIHRFLQRWREGYEVVYGIRRSRKEGLAKRLAYSLFYRLLHVISDIRIPIDSGDFCLMDRRVVDALLEMPERIRFVRGMRAFVGFRQIGEPYERQARRAGEPSYDFRKLILLAIDGLFGFSMLPLRLASILGVMIAAPSFLVGIYFLLHRLFQFPLLGHYATETPGLASLAVGLFFLSGLILIILGIIGEYLGRIYIEVKGRPTYIIAALHDEPAASTGIRARLDHGVRDVTAEKRIAHAASRTTRAPADAIPPRNTDEGR